ncbi:Scd6-like Sm domain-containing protein [Lentinula aciculospora]|uniref:Scd6-like Sm domain-containing protein n=1 Tax=Lentinula aciculospora TaxID=153920 RepID=A0A9W9A8V8_9AGAR|nr:Scd6-like Sm domain-containing protein [Lentinula aciculospora]
MATSFIGKPISLISHSDVRYRGILAGIDPAASTIQLSKVYSMGTENRRPPQEFIPPVPDPYEYIIFRASEVKDLAVDQSVEPPRGRSVHDDPAVIGASSQLPPQHLPSTQQQAPFQQPQPTPSQFTQETPPSASASASSGGAAPSAAAVARARAQRLHTATASLETVERALGDLRISQQQPANGSGNSSRRRGGASGGTTFKVPNVDFDFESSNRRFVKAHNSDDSDQTSSGEEDDDGSKKKSSSAGTSKTSHAYDPTKSFFDSLTPGQGGGGSTGPRGGPNGMNGAQVARARREEERVKNVATFGEPGRLGNGGMRPGGYGVGMGGGHPNMRGGRGGRGSRGGSGRGGFVTSGPGRRGRVPSGNVPAVAAGDLKA